MPLVIALENVTVLIISRRLADVDRERVVRMGRDFKNLLRRRVISRVCSNLLITVLSMNEIVTSARNTESPETVMPLVVAETNECIVTSVMIAFEVAETNVCAEVSEEVPTLTVIELSRLIIIMFAEADTNV